ncbi:hypothetical protein HMPREF9071_1425, partial [Capnocytophaga sp. oral taxon 338 str. F0234]
FIRVYLQVPKKSLNTFFVKILYFLPNILKIKLLFSYFVIYKFEILQLFF